MAQQTLAGTSAVAKVNLLPPEISEKNKARRSQVAMIGTGLAAVGVVGALYAMQAAKISAAKSDLAREQARTTALTAEARKLDNVAEIYAQRQAAEQLLSQAMAKEIRWSRFLTDLSLTIPANVWLDSMEVKQVVDTATVPGGATAPGAGAAGNQVLVDPGLGTVSFKGNAFEYDDVAAWLEALLKQKGYTNQFLASAGVIDGEKFPTGPYKFDSVVAIDPSALSNRYTTKAGG